MSKTAWLLTLNSISFVLLALGVSQCSGSSCPQWECSLDLDCEERPWPGDAGCEPNEGEWRCFGGQCTAVCAPCETNAGCTSEPWMKDCSGHYACAEGRCLQLCDSEGCGDGLCDEAGGETRESCPADCEQQASCTVPGDCLQEDWELPCEGRWDCALSACLETCDYDSCGDGTCNASAGENEQTCPQDCLEGCKLPSDCFPESWDQICQGRWSCFQGDCMSVCDSNTCGNGVCEGLNGENEDSCFKDCLGGPCNGVIDCLGQYWYERECSGHWQCNPPAQPGQVATGACEAICDDVACGDGRCDTLTGETPGSCLADCGSNSHSCTKSEDCAVLPLPEGCSGTWICSSKLCFPQCE